ncbi:interferon-induced protein 44-like [Clarias gariepinus]|uniref:interferon-induced protein 44-like n=1 Tax=Clarias gariepinus TaxID=13013 RepID=UPI00234C5698|nr:interferon-induced protein 44-like [Clarias gariepinus]XP_053353473.1 interferon-induced protein 44-like [Clarias gariepinus]
MSVITSRLSKQQELKLCSLLGQVKLRLLFKASVHGFTADAFHSKCDYQGPTVTVAYNNSGYVFGAYTSKDYTWTNRSVVDDKSFLFSVNERRADKAPLHVARTSGQYAFTDGNTGPNFISLLFLHNNTATVYSNPGTYNFNPVEMHGNDLQLSECEVYRVEGLGPLMEKQWRNIEWSEGKRESLMDTISHWTPSVSSVQKARVLLVGAVGAGKSSFFNSVSSVFKGHVSCRANTGIAGTSLTTQFRVYSIKAGDKFLPVTLCDSMGLEEGANAGMDIDDFTNILKGHIQDGYQFNPSVPLQSDSSYFSKTPSMQEKIHAVVYVMDACKIKLLSDTMMEKLTAFRRKANHMGIPQMVLLTKVDEACPLAGEDMKHVYRSHYLYKTIQEVSACLGISLSSVVPVKNYSNELELEPNTDIVLLNAVQQILRTAESYFDNVACDKK